MSRERLMAEQRRRMEERRKRLKSIKEAQAQKKADIKKYGSGGGKAVTRNLNKDVSKEVQKYGSRGGKAVTRDSSKDVAKKTTVAQPASKKSAGPVTTKTNKVPQRFADGGKGGKYDKAVNKQKAIRNFSQSASGTRGKSLPSDPKLKSQSTKPKRSSFPSGRQGATAYSAALKKYNTLQERIKRNQPKKKYDRRGRSI